MKGYAWIFSPWRFHFSAKVANDANPIENNGFIVANFLLIPANQSKFGKLAKIIN